MHANIVQMKTMKTLIMGTSLEHPARSLARMFRKIYKSEWDHRIQRDEKNTEKLLHRILKSDSNCLDIGAHRGLFLKRFVQLAPKGKHYAFEPLPELARALSQEFPDVEIFNCALSNRTGKDTFYHVRELEAWSGLHKQHYPRDTVPVEIQVELRRLDDIIGSEAFVHFMKIDVEGAELEVLQGSVSTILRCLPVILFEHAKIHNEVYGTTSDMVYDLLVSTCGLKICDLEFSQTFSKDEFLKIYESSFASNYDRKAQTNFVALPVL